MEGGRENRVTLGWKKNIWSSKVLRGHRQMLRCLHSLPGLSKVNVQIKKEVILHYFSEQMCSTKIEDH